MSRRATLQLIDRGDDDKDQLVWKWTKGAATTLAELGGPFTSDDYVLCPYDAAGWRATLRVPAGGTCQGKPCWRPKSKGFAYRGHGGAPDGITALTLKPGADGKAQIQAKGKGDLLPMPSLPSLAAPLTVQLRNATSGACWSATYMNGRAVPKENPMTTRLLAIMSVFALCIAGTAIAQTIAPTFDPDYDFVVLGAVPSLPTNAGGLTFAPSDPNTILIGGAANGFTADVFSIAVTRGAGGHITAFSGTATFYADATGASGGIDGGLSFGPGGVLFFTSYSDNRLGQIKPGSTTVDKLVDLNAAAIGVASSVGALAFVPAGFPGAGRLKLAQYSGSGNWYDVTLAPDANGTYDVTGASFKVAIGGGPEGIIYIAAGNAQFAVPSILVSEYGGGNIAAYEIDANGDPVVATRRVFMSGLGGAEGAVVDPVTGDFLFSTFGNGNRVIVVKGFIPPAPALNHFLFYKVKTTKGDLCVAAAPANAGEICETEEDCGGTTDVTVCVSSARRFRG